MHHHPASIAAGAETHFVVRKDDSDSMTKSQIDKLDERQRVGEIARMLTGEHESKASRKAAKELLKHAQSATTAVAAQ